MALSLMLMSGSLRPCHHPLHQTLMILTVTLFVPWMMFSVPFCCILGPRPYTMTLITILPEMMLFTLKTEWCQFSFRKSSCFEHFKTSILSNSQKIVSALRNLIMYFIKCRTRLYRLH